DIFGRAALVGHRLGDFRRRHHVDRVPWAPTFAQLAADAALQVDIAKRLHARLVFTGDFVDAVNGANFDAGLAARAVISANHRHLGRQFLASLPSSLGHGLAFLNGESTIGLLI